MSINYNPDAIEEIRMMQNYYCVPEHAITVEMVCNHSIDQRLPQYLIQDMMSYMYGVYEDIAVYGNDRYTRQTGVTHMNAFDEAINLLDGEDYIDQLNEIANSGEPRSPGPSQLPPPQGFDEAHAVGGSPSMLTLDSPLMAPPDIVRHTSNNSSLPYLPMTPPESMTQPPLTPTHLACGSQVYGLNNEDGDYSFATPTRSIPETLEHTSPPNVVRRQMFSIGSIEFASDDDSGYEPSQELTGWD
jgi:hypothetical protein